MENIRLIKCGKIFIKIEIKLKNAFDLVLKVGRERGSEYLLHVFVSY